MQATRRPPKTRADLDAPPEDVRAELIRGEPCVPPSPSDAHQRIALELADVLARWGRAGGAGRLRIAPLDVHLPSGDVVQPDLLFVATGRVAIMHADGLRGAPDLAVEVVSPAHPERDRILERDLYAESGVPECWIVDPGERAIEVFRLGRGAYVPAGRFRAGEALVAATLPGLRLDTARVFAD